MRLIAFCLLLLGVAVVSACTRDGVPPGRIRVKNDSQDSEYNVVNVSGGGAFYSLKPGERALMPKGTRTLTFSRRYKDYTREYEVECPEGMEKGISIKLIDVHVNRIAGGCKTVRATKG